MTWDHESIGQRIKWLRLSHKWTQAQLGHETDLSEMTINRIETGTTRVLGEFLERIAAALNFPEDYILNGDSHAERETLRLLASLRDELNITESEEVRLKQMVSEALQARNNARVPLNRLELESLLMVLRGE